jgi:phage terminase large subunit-like protein
MPLDEWQENVLEAAMGERADGRWAARLVGLSTPRQNGKSQLIVARALAGALLLDEKTIICSAHQMDTAREVFQRLLDVIDANPGIARRVESVMKAVGREYIRFKGGQTIRIKARSVSGSRGFSADCLLLDEAQILGSAAWSSILPTMSARENPQAWLLGTPPTPQDDGEVFARLRERGLEGKDARLAYLEWSADQDDDIDSPMTWAMANPAFGTRISVEAIEAERSAMTDEQFAMERLGMWSLVRANGIIPQQSWTEAGSEHSLAVDRFALGVECGPDLAWASVSFAGQRADGEWHFELDEDQHTKGRGTAWLVPHLEYLTEANAQIRSVVVDVAGPIKALLEQRNGGRWFFRHSKLEVTPVTVSDLGAGCSRVLDGIVTGWLHHIDQPQFTAAALAAGKRPLGDTGMWVWSRKAAESDITPIQAGTLALIGAQNTNVRKPAKKAGGRRVVTA